MTLEIVLNQIKKRKNQLYKYWDLHYKVKSKVDFERFLIDDQVLNDYYIQADFIVGEIINQQQRHNWITTICQKLKQKKMRNRPA